MQRVRSVWASFLLTRAAGLAVDSAAMGFAYLLAFALRFDFQEPHWGWRAVATSFVAVWIAQLAALLATGCYALPWRRTSATDVPRYVLAFFLSGAGLTCLRYLLPDLRQLGIRPPYSITLYNTFLALAAVLALRVLWRFYSAARAERRLLINRDEGVPDARDVLDMLRGRTVLVTGAGGSIGSEIVRQCARGGAARVVMVERGENALYEIDRRMRALGAVAPCIPEMADVSDETRMRGILARTKPDVVLHAAAYKHVPMVEAHPLEGLRNNTLATRRLGELAREAGVARFVMISTDKAVNPASVMGATKRLAETLLLDLNAPGRTIFSAVRFGNVLGSSGSVVPLFREQIAHRGPVTVTHPDMKRYFMTVREAVSLVLQSAALAKGGEIFTLDMGEPVAVLDLAESMIRDAGYRPYVDVPIVFTGIRPGEKLVEELGIDSGRAFRTGHARIYVCRSEAQDAAAVMAELRRLDSPLLSADDLRARLGALVGRER